MAKKMSITLELQPLKGEMVTKQVQVDVTITGTTVGAIVERSNIDLANRDVMVDRKPATPTTIVPPNATIRISERIKGS